MTSLSASPPEIPCLRAASVAVQEPPVDTDGSAWNERHLQCIWSDEGLRPALSTTDGRSVLVLDPGVWNGAAGPDFRGATVAIGGDRRTGDIEIHVRPGDWLRHGHADDPAYANVILHVTWFEPREGESLPDVPLAVLSGPLLARPGFSFSTIDPDAYPWLTRADRARPCRDALVGARPAEVAELLAEAGRLRVRRFATRLDAAFRPMPDGRVPTEAEVFYAETMACLGFHRNAAAMRSVAASVSLVRLAEIPDPMERYALLLSVAGLLPADDEAGCPAEWRGRVWAAASRLGIEAAPPTERPVWRTAGVRPLNHPRVRLAIAANMFARPGRVWETLSALPRTNPKVWVRLAREALVSAARGAERLAPPRKMPFKGLLGAHRIHSILVNAAIPLLARQDGAVWRLVEAVPGEDLGGSMKEMAFRLLGGDHNPALYTHNALRMQGLLELWRGCERATAADCAACPLSGGSSS